MKPSPPNTNCSKKSTLNFLDRLMENIKTYYKQLQGTEEKNVETNTQEIVTKKVFSNNLISN